MSGLALWLRSDQGVIAGGTGNAVATWTDLSGSSRDATQSTSENRPTRTWAESRCINGWPVIDFDGSNDYLSITAGVGGPSAAEVFVVGRIDADPPAGGAQTGLWTFSWSGLYTHHPYTDGVIYDDFGSTVRHTTVDPVSSLSSPFIYNVTAAAGEWTSRLNGTELYATNSNTVNWTSAPMLGTSWNGMFLDGVLAEFLLFSRKLVQSERAQIFTYLRNRYGIWT